MKEETKKRKIGLLVLIPVLVLVLIVVGFLIFSPKTVKAQLLINEGSVQVNHGNGWVNAVDEMKLSTKDKVRTLENSKATIIFFESDVIRLDANTELSLDQITPKNVKLNQSSGTTWSKINKLAGIQKYEVETPNTVATVRGTAFEIEISNGDSDIAVGDGIVDALDKNTKEQTSLNLFEAARFEKGKIIKHEITELQKRRIIERKMQDIETLKLIRDNEIKKNQFIVSMIKKKYNFTDSDFKAFIEDMDNGGKIYDIEGSIKALPIKPKNLQKILAISEAIRKQKEQIQLIKSNEDLPGEKLREILSEKVEIISEQ